ncbi:MAG TPA: acyl-CoA synthetase [Acidimicrobiales bacterium]|jgi:acyl-CoA synthetase (AMP-forming)/AMP-acid ligase II|nr:acyl-CoA synthetase [Acidimicrobiales bacterium]
MVDATLPAPPATFHYADLFEYAVDRVPDREAVVCGERRLTYRQLDRRANRLAHALLAAGVTPGEFVAIFLPNCTEYIEAMIAAWKIRATPINVNHRYVTDELQYLLDDCGAAAVVCGRAQAGAVAGLAGATRSRLRTVLVVDEPESSGPPLADGVASVPGSVAYDEVIAAQPDDRPAVQGRSGDDHYVLYTGGTTGMPKGVVWRMEDALFPCFGGGDPSRLHPVAQPADMANRMLDSPLTYFCLPPMMHAAGQWVAFSWLWAGGRVVLYAGSFDPERVWQEVADERANLVTVVGDAIGRPLLDAWLTNPGRWDTSALFSLSNGGAPMSPALRLDLVDTFPNLVLNDGFGSSETGAQGGFRASSDGPDDGVARFRPYDDNTVVVDDDGDPVEPGSDVVGRVALRGRIPLGYLNDPERTAKSFVLHGGDRWVITGDMAQVEPDGTIRLLGRGSGCINTGGEKVFPEEVEAALHALDDVADVTVVGVPDDRWGQAVCAVVQPAPGATLELDDLRDRTRAHLAGYKLPKRLVVVDEIRRSPAGKADLRWAKALAEAAE